MKKVGMFLIGIAIVGLLYFALLMDTSVKVDYPKGYSYGLPERVNNIGLINDKQNYIIVSGIILFAGLMLFLFYNKQKRENNINTENETEYHTENETEYHTENETECYCQKCGEKLFLEMEEIENKKYLCPVCNSMNILA